VCFKIVLENLEFSRMLLRIIGVRGGGGWKGLEVGLGSGLGWNGR
jgi:hypothetical protein